MYKFMMITNYRENIPSQYGTKNVLNGLLYHNIDERVVGRQNYTIWVNEKHPLKQYLKPEYVGKDLYIQFGPNGYIEKCEVK